MHDEARTPPNDRRDVDLLDELPDLTCPSCGADLVDDELFISHRVCADCGRHFSIPARARLEMIVDPGSFREIATPIRPDEEPGNDHIAAIDRISEQYERPVLDEAIVVGTAAISGARVVVISMDDQLLGAHIGALATEKIITGLERALSRRLPVVALCTGGSARTQAGPLAMVQGARLAAMSAQVQVAGVPMIAVLSHPTSAEIFGTFASQCDLIFAEPGTQVGVTSNASRSLEAVEQALLDVELVAQGWIDGIVARPEVRRHLGDLLDVLAKRGLDVAPTTAPVPAFEPGDDEATGNTRIRGVEYLTRIVTSFTEMRGDRVDADDPRVRCGFGRIGDVAVAVVAQDHAASSDSGRTAPIRKVQRLARLAGRFEMPLVLLVDSPTGGDANTVRPDESLAIAKLGSMLAMLPVPVVSAAVGPVRGTLGTVMMTGDRRLMLEQAAYYLGGSSLSRGGRFSASGGDIWGQPWSARECERLGLVDVVVPEAESGVRGDPGWTAMTLKDAVSRALAELSGFGPRRLVEARHQRHRMLGQETEEGLAAIRFEAREWQEVQQSVAKSIEDLRERFGQRMSGSGRLTIQRPDLGELAARLRARREELRQELLERTGRGER